ncbi:MAG: S8 family peptidase [Muribaculaceae bacterium]|nr:S8 family peptidase [Muribaculaceae bacterium]
MKKIVITVLSMCALVTMSAQSKIDLMGQAQLRQHRMEQRVKNTGELNSLSRVESLADEVVVFVALEEGASASDLVGDGVEVLDSRGDLALVRVPIDQVERFSQNVLVKKIEFGKKVLPKMDVARGFSGVDMAHEGVGLEQTYTGAGVVAGVFDTGLDPNHLAFKNAEQTESRVQRVWRYKGQSGLLSIYDTPQKIANFSTDNSASSHGTHVAGIMAGGYLGNELYGVAPDADIVIGCGDLYDANIILGTTRMIDYAIAEGKPIVVNLSLGVNTGPHDGTDYFSRYIDELGKDAVICVSSGNEGTQPIALHHKFENNSEQVKTFVSRISGSGIYYGTIDCWSADNSVVKLSPAIYDLVEDKIVYQMPVCDKSTGGEWQYLSSAEYFEEGDFSDQAFDQAFQGFMGYASTVVSDNKRYEVAFYLYMAETADNNGRYVPAMIFEGNEGQQIYGYSDGSYVQFANNNREGWYAGTTNGSISDMACGHNVIVVGSCDSRKSYKTKDGYTASYNGVNIVVGNASEFTSYGELLDGRKLPHILAPGCVVLSSYSSPYMKSALAAGTEREEYAAAKVSQDGVDYYWGPMVGSSMASPFMAGTAALWLQANSELTVHDILDIATETATKAESSINPIQCGAGRVSVFNGLKKVLNDATGIGEIVTNPSEKLLLQPLGEKVFEVFVAGENGFAVSICDMSGRVVKQQNSASNSCVIDMNGFGKGIYVLLVQCGNSHHTSRIVVK